jgi:hypothetical protein
MAAVPIMDEEMHQGASQDQQVWQDAQNMGPMFRQQEEGTDEQKAAGGDGSLGLPEAGSQGMIVVLRVCSVRIWLIK